MGEDTPPDRAQSAAEELAGARLVLAGNGAVQAAEGAAVLACSLWQQGPLLAVLARDLSDGEAWLV